MEEKRVPTLSLQSVSLYQLLLKAGPLSVNKLAKNLGILPNAVYRLAKSLERFGCLERIYQRPVIFSAKPVSKAIQTYLLIHRQWFLNNFQSPVINKGETNKIFDLFFIQSRQELLESYAGDLKSAETEVDLIVSGLEIPAEIMLENKKATDRGVIIKVLTQFKTNYSLEMWQNWQKIGLKVKFLESVNLRIIIIDKQIVYLVSFDQDKKEKGVGIRINYYPLANLIAEVFSQYWQKAKSIQK